jgi:general secretion pathway protein A
MRWAVPVFGAAAAVVIVAGFLTTLDGRRELIDAAVDARPPTAMTEAEASPVIETVVQEEETEASLDAQLSLAADITTPESALVTLLELWGVEYQPGQSGCSQAATAGYECVQQRGSWSGLKQFDRPAVLTLVDHKGAAHSVVLTAIEGDSVELSISGVSVTHPIDQVSDMWFGQYTLLWRPPNGSSHALGPGSRGLNVLWLRQSLAEIDASYQTTAMASDIFDADLQQQVRTFQRDHRLDVDGVAGRQTQIIINTLLAHGDAPRLTIPRLAQE